MTSRVRNVAGMINKRQCRVKMAKSSP